MAQVTVKAEAAGQALDWPRIAQSLLAHSLLGLGAFGVLAVVEWVDTSVRLAPSFQSLGERAVFSAYFSLNLAVGLVVGFAVGVASSAGRALTRLLTRGRQPRSVYRVVLWLGICGLGAALLNQLHPVRTFSIGLIREAEKLSDLRTLLLNHERATSYLLVAGLLFSSLGMSSLSVASSRTSWARHAWLSILAVVLLTVYYVDSRISVQLYEHAMHRSLFLLNVLVSMSLVGSAYRSWASENRFRWGRSWRHWWVMLVVLIGALVFTFNRFDGNHNLKTLVFYQTTQLKQCFKLARWALDFDRDGYSAVLGGGDADDRRPDINPGRLEVAQDGLDNNCLAGDLTQAALDEWKADSASLRPRAPLGPRRFNVIFFFVDTLRADHLSAYGYHRQTTRNIDRLAARGTLFQNAYTPSPRTSEAVQKFMQSSYWDAHLESWTEVLARQGYNTMLFPGRRSWERYKRWMPVVGRAQGKALAQNIDVAIETLDSLGTDQPFCAYVYVPDPHKPYIKHESFDYGDSVVDLYDGEVAYTDFHLGRFFDWMERSGRFGDTVVVLMSDHGESLGERGVYLHSTQLYDEQMRVPLIVYVPGETPRRVADYVTTVDLGPTILDSLGLSWPAEYVGVSLLPAIRGEPFTHPPVYGEQTGQEISPFVRLDQQVHPESKKYMVISQDGFKLIFNRDPYSFELYGLSKDPGELRNLHDQLGEKAEQMKRLIGRFVDVVTASRPWDADEGRYSRAGNIDGDKVEE
jgi:arylsulfatase A-like enzyme